jgi:hypothetical protein
MVNITRAPSKELRHGLRRLAAIGLAVFSWPLIVIGLVLWISPSSSDIVLIWGVPFFGSWYAGAIICMLVLTRSLFEIRLIRRSGGGSIRHRVQAIAVSSLPILVVGLSAWLVYGQHWA